uniref:Uncharacterized protein n=1 Tax=Erpetoichthys calabaricus TaxID=27687 RepID=A0A8C4SPH6_ERPCA
MSPLILSNLPSTQDLIQVIYHQCEYIQHLEAEVKFCKGELSDMKQTLTVVMLEKEKLNEELKTRTFGDTLKDFTIFDTSNTVFSFYSNFRKELSASQQESEDLKEKLRHQESLIALSQHEIELAQAHANVHLQAKERLTKERDELIIMLTSLRTELDEFQQRELSAYQQVKQAVEMAEEANLEKVKAMVQCELLRSEIERKKNELKKVLAAEQEKIAKVRDKTKDEMKREKQNMETTVL